MKEHLRVLGIDDSPFRFGNAEALVIGVVMRLPTYVEGVLSAKCAVDGGDATDVLVGMVDRSRFKEQLRLVMIDGVAIGGFNVVDIDEMYEATGIPIATVTRDPPDLVMIRSALEKHFPDHERRFEIIARKPLRPVATEHKPILVSLAGIDMDEAAPLIQKSIVRGAVPEPIRVAHIIASGMTYGESHGKA